MVEPVLSPDVSRREVSDLMGRINAAWLDGRPRDLLQLLHPEIVMVYPGFTGRSTGREALVEGFVDFCENAVVHSFEEHDHQVDVIGNTAVATSTFAMLYEREGQRYRSTGRDFWVFQREQTSWVAVWRTMLEVTDEPAA